MWKNQNIAEKARSWAGKWTRPTEKMERKRGASLIVQLCLGAFLFFSAAVPGNYPYAEHSGSQAGQPALESAATQPETDPLLLNSRAAVLLDGDTGRVLYGKNETEVLPMASTTKIMTCILALENAGPDTEVLISDRAASMPEVKLHVRKGERYRLRDLLYSMMLESHNDTAVAIAEHLGGSVSGFAAKMNQKAKLLGMSSTHFITPNGLDANGHYSTASDMCKLASYAIKNKDFLSLVQTKSHSFSDCSGKYHYSLTNHDAFLSYYEGALGIKTGFTGKAGYCFVGAAKKNGITLTSCVLASGWPPNKSFKWSDTKSLMDYGFFYFQKTPLPVQNLALAKIPVKDGKKKFVSLKPIIPKETLTASFDSLKIVYRIPTALCAPIRKNTPIGSISFYINNKLFQKTEVFPSESIEKSCFSDTIEQVLNQWMDIFCLS